VDRDSAAVVAGPFDLDPDHLIDLQQAGQLSKSMLGVRDLLAGQEPAAGVDDRNREIVFVGFDTSKQRCRLPIDVTAGSATRKHLGRVVDSVDLTPSHYRASSPTTNRHLEAAIEEASPCGGQQR
jgi:hypothetical protein